MQQNSIKFGTDFTQPRKKFTQALPLLARLYVFLSLYYTSHTHIIMLVLHLITLYSHTQTYDRHTNNSTIGIHTIV